MPTKRIMTVAISVGTRFPAYATARLIEHDLCRAGALLTRPSP